MLRIKIKPPTHKIDAPGILISALDAWDYERIEKEELELDAHALEEMQVKAIEEARQKADLSEAEIEDIKASCILSEEEQGEARAKHPFRRYHSGKTRYQPDAPDTDPAGKPVTVREYLKEEATEFSVRRLSYQEYQRAHEPVNTVKRFTAFLKAALVELRSPGDGYCWKAKAGELEAPEAVLQAIHDAGPSLLVELGSKVMAYLRPLDEAEEGKL